MNKFEQLLRYDNDIQRHLGMIESITKEMFNMYKSIICPYTGNVLELNISYLQDNNLENNFVCGEQLYSTIIIFPVAILRESIDMSLYLELIDDKKFNIDDIIYTVTVITLIHELSHANQKITMHKSDNMSREEHKIHFANIETSNTINTFNLLTNDKAIFDHVYTHPHYNFIYDVLYIESRDAINNYVDMCDVCNKDNELINTLNMEYQPYNTIIEQLYYCVKLHPENDDDIDYNNRLYMLINTCKNVKFTLIVQLDGDETALYSQDVKENYNVSTNSVQGLVKIFNGVYNTIYFTLSNKFSYNVKYEFGDTLDDLHVTCLFAFSSEGANNMIIRH